MKRASPYPKWASAAQRGYRMPSLHWLSTSIQEFMWNSKSWPEGIPRKKVGTKTAKAASAMVSRGEPKSGPCWLAEQRSLRGRFGGTEQIVA